MVESIYKLKNKILQHVERESQDMDRVNVRELGELVDMVKDLAEAEKECWEATYYRTVTEAMEKGSSGYTTGTPMTLAGYGSSAMRQGYDSGFSSHDDIISKLGDAYHNLSPEERMSMKSKVLTMLGSM